MRYLYYTKDNSSLLRSHIPSLNEDYNILEIESLSRAIFSEAQGEIGSFLDIFLRLKESGELFESASLVCLKDGDIVAGIILSHIDDGIRIEDIYLKKEMYAPQLAHCYLEAFKIIDDLEEVLLPGLINTYHIFRILEIGSNINKKYYQSFLKGMDLLPEEMDLLSRAEAEYMRLYNNNVANGMVDFDDE